MSASPDDKDKMMVAVRRLIDDEQPVQIELYKFELWTVLSQLQLAFRHPRNTGPAREHAERTAEQLSEALIANDPDLRLLWNMGKCKEFDEPHSHD